LNRLGRPRLSSDDFILRCARSQLLLIVGCFAVSLHLSALSFIVQAFGGHPPTMPSADFSTVFSTDYSVPSFDLLKHRRDLTG
jgi:hypothetical protein